MNSQTIHPSNTFTPRLPNWIDNPEFDRSSYPFNTVEELIKHPYIQHWINSKSFVELRQSDNCLLAICDDTEWQYGSHWAIGYLKLETPLNLPTWKHKQWNWNILKHRLKNIKFR